MIRKLKVVSRLPFLFAVYVLFMISQFRLVLRKGYIILFGNSLLEICQLELSHKVTFCHQRQSLTFITYREIVVKLIRMSRSGDSVLLCLSRR